MKQVKLKTEMREVETISDICEVINTNAESCEDFMKAVNKLVKKFNGLNRKQMLLGLTVLFLGKKVFDLEKRVSAMEAKNLSDAVEEDIKELAEEE